MEWMKYSFKFNVNPFLFLSQEGGNYSNIAGALYLSSVEVVSNPVCSHVKKRINFTKAFKKISPTSSKYNTVLTCFYLLESNSSHQPLQIHHSWALQAIASELVIWIAIYQFAGSRTWKYLWLPYYLPSHFCFISKSTWVFIVFENLPAYWIFECYLPAQHRI